MGKDREKEKEEERGFKVEDRRRFSPDTGEPRETEEKPARPESHKEEPRHQGDEKKAAAGEPLPEINFSTFVISLSTQALMHLGEIPNPVSGQEGKDITVAKQMIDIIGLLRDKTKGNLDEGEQKLMEDILFDLRMKYVEAVRKR